MADNTVLNTGTGGDTIATDDDGIAKHQYVKVEFGGDGTFTPVTTSTGLPADVLDRAARDCGKIDVAMGQGAHDAAGSAFDPVAIAGYASAAAPIDVTADTDIVRAWHLRNGAQATVITAAGALVGGDAANGLDVDVTRVTGTVTISGTVTANAGTNLNTSALALDATLTSQQLTDNAAFTDGTTKLAMAGYIFDDTAGTALTENDAAAARISSNRATVCAIEDGATRARYATVSAANALKVDGSAVTQPISAATLDAATLVDNAGFTDGTSRVMMAGFILDDTAGTVLTENDAAAPRISANRAVVCAIEDGATRARYATVSAANALKVDGSAVTQPVSGTVTANLAAGTNTNEVVGDVAQDVAVAGNPLLIGGRASAAAPTDMSADGDSVYLWTTLKGAINVADGAGSLTVDNGGTFATQIDGSALTALQLIDNPVVADDAVFTPGTTSVMMAGFQADETSTDSVNEGDGGAARMTLDRKVIVTAQPHSSGGCSISHLVSAASTNATNVKASAGQLYGWSIFNTNAAIRYVKLHNNAGAPTAGSGVVYTIGVPATGGSNIALATGLAFSTGIAFTTVTGIADADATAVAANDLVINLHFF